MLTLRTRKGEGEFLDSTKKGTGEFSDNIRDGKREYAKEMILPSMIKGAVGFHE